MDSINGNSEEMNNLLNDIEVDAIGEIMNISMGSAATAISSMLDKQVLITTPKVRVTDVGSLDYSFLEPSMLVNITYIKGITGSNIMVFRQRDMQYILNTLMGIDEPPKDDYEFDEMSISAACEVMNQMMGASATALSEFLGRRINISIPTAVIMDEQNTVERTVDMDSDENVVAILFDLTIADIMKSEFVCIMELKLAKMIVNQFMKEDVDGKTTTINGDAVGYATMEQNEQPDYQEPITPADQPLEDNRQSVNTYNSSPGNMAYTRQEMNQSSPVSDNIGQPTAYGQQPPYSYGYPAPGWGQMPPQANNPNAAGYPYPPQFMPPYMPFPPQAGYPNVQAGTGGNGAHAAESAVLKESVNVQNVQFPNFEDSKPVFSAPLSSGNMNLLMNVPLSVSIEIGRTKKKIRDIMEFSQGSIIELEKQAGAPVDIIVNGQLMARGDVVVIDDNFAVRVTEIIGTKELIGSLEDKENQNKPENI